MVSPYTATLPFSIFLCFIINCACSSSEYRTPELEEITTDSIIWIGLKEGQKLNDYFIHDGDVYCGEVAHNRYPLKNVDVASFEVLANTRYARDLNHLYYPLQTVCVDGENWGNCHAVEYMLKGADPSTFDYIGDEHGKDRFNVYFRGIKIKNTTPQEFENLGQGYARSETHVFYRGNILVGEDPSTFLVPKHNNE